VKRLGRAAAAVALSVSAVIGLSGCPALLIPGLAVEGIYEGYKYERSRAESSRPGSGQSQSSNAEKKNRKNKQGGLRERFPQPRSRRLD